MEVFKKNKKRTMRGRRGSGINEADSDDLQFPPRQQSSV